MVTKVSFLLFFGGFSESYLSAKTNAMGGLGKKNEILFDGRKHKSEN